MRYVRVLAEGTEDNPHAPPIYVDAIIDDDANIIGRHALFGLQGRFDRKDEHFEPFVLDHKGQMDWGDGFDSKPNDRLGNFDLRDGPLNVGRLLKLRTYNYPICRYRIARVIQLPSEL
jgi:hypothetical protein